jgi:hypothetical protein
MTETIRPFTTAGELTAGQHVRLRVDTPPYRVDHTYRVETGQVLLLLVPVGGGNPSSVLWKPSTPFELVADEELAELEVVARRARLVAALHELADDIERLELPVPEYRAELTVMPGPRADVDRWASLLGVEVHSHPDGWQVACRDGSPLSVRVIGDRLPEPDADAVQADADALVDGITTLLDNAADSKLDTDAEHVHVGGTIGGLGENEVECACGLVFGGFDSQASAMAFMERHIDNPEPTAVDLSHKGVDRILAGLAEAGLEVHYNETDGDTAIDIWLTELDPADNAATILSWRDTEGWLLRQWEQFYGDTNTQTPDRKWPITAGGLVEVARDVSAILAEQAGE